ncbi:hypothetical protein B0H14DRAFT_3494194 [Mycena olivaceomarginata]|nr:hypothetical protein B0H14DRAFT_3494194 [Mycena olivaceomarginata]
MAAATPIGPGTDIPSVITVCSGSVGVGCVNIPIVSDTCANLSGGLSFFNKQISTATIPVDSPARSSTVKGGTDSDVVLSPGTWHFSAVPGLSGTTT